MTWISVMRVARELAKDDGRDFEALTPEATDRYIEAARAALALGVNPPSPLPLPPDTETP